MDIGAVGGGFSYYSYDPLGKSGKAAEETSGFTEDVFSADVETTEYCFYENNTYSWKQRLMCQKAEESTEEEPVYEVSTYIAGMAYVEKIHINDIWTTNATQQEMYAFFEHVDSVNGTEGSYEKFMAYMETAKKQGYWEGNNTYEQFANDTYNWRDTLPKVWGDAYNMGLYQVYSEGVALHEQIEKAFISKVDFSSVTWSQREIQTQISFSWPDIPQEINEVLSAFFTSDKYSSRAEEESFYDLEFGIRRRIEQQIEEDGSKGSLEGMLNSAISVLESMYDELDSYFGDKLGGMDFVKEEVNDLKKMYKSIIQEMQKVKKVVETENEAEEASSEEDFFKKALIEYIAEIYDKIKNGETEEKFQIGAMSLTLEEWDALLKKFDDLEEEIKQAIKLEIEKKKEEDRAKEIAKTDETVDGATLLASEVCKSVFREATEDEEELSYITCFTPEGIICKKTGMDEKEYLWKLDFEDDGDYEKVKALMDSFPSDWNLKFAPNEKFWKDYLSERIDLDDFVANLKEYSDKGKMNYFIEKDGNTYINRDAIKYCNYMNNPEDRIYNLQEFTELIANKLKENQKKLVDANDEDALKRIDEQIEAFKRNMLGGAYNKLWHKDYFSKNYIWRADNTEEVFRIFDKNGEMISIVKYFDFVRYTDEELAAKYGLSGELLKTAGYVRGEK